MTSLDIWDTLTSVLDGVGVLIGVVAIVFGLLTLLVAAWGCWAFVRRTRESLNIVRDWPRTRATVTAVHTRQFRLGNDVLSREIADYTFTDASGQEHQGLDVEPVHRAPVVGMQFEVTYDPEDPTASHPTHRIGLRIATWALIFTVVLVLLLGLAYLQVRVGVDALI